MTIVMTKTKSTTLLMILMLLLLVMMPMMMMTTLYGRNRVARQPLTYSDWNRIVVVALRSVKSNQFSKEKESVIDDG